MGHYTIRTNDDEDQVIRKAQEATGMASASKTFMAAILEHKANRDEIMRLRQELVQAQSRNKELAQAVRRFHSSMKEMFSLSDNL